MSLTMALFTFLNVWWVMLFFVLPFGVEQDHTRSPDRYIAAPKLFNWKKKLWINTLLSIMVTGIIALLLASGVVPLRDVVE